MKYCSGNTGKPVKLESFAEITSGLIADHAAQFVVMEQIDRSLRAMEEFETLGDHLKMMRNAIKKQTLNTKIVGMLNTRGELDRALESIGMSVNLGEMSNTDLIHVEDRLLAVLSKDIVSATEGWYDTFKAFIQKVIDWFLGLFSMNKRMQNAFEKIQRTWNPSKVDAEHFATIVVKTGMEHETTAKWNTILDGWEKRYTPFLTRFFSINFMDVGKMNVIEINEEWNIAKSVEALFGKMNVGGMDGDKMNIDLTKILFIDNTAKELGFNPANTLDMVKVSAKSLLHIDRIGNKVAEGSKKVASYYAKAREKDGTSESHQSKAVAQIYKNFYMLTKTLAHISNISAHQLYHYARTAKMVSA